MCDLRENSQGSSSGCSEWPEAIATSIPCALRPLIRRRNSRGAPPLSSLVMSCKTFNALFSPHPDGGCYLQDGRKGEDDQGLQEEDPNVVGDHLDQQGVHAQGDGEEIDGEHRLGLGAQEVIETVGGGS